ncbi:hypothetical protein NX059_008835 [Plenodomus lindquistii]|nr:hypothetical protein NX059_008835 [Plenodomus lindquistii]
MSTTRYHNATVKLTSWQQQLGSSTYREPSTERAGRKVQECDILPGRIFWLPSEEELPERAVRPVKGKGPIEDRIYSHPVVITSRPVDGGYTVHFQLITSLQGKTLDQLYNKPTDFHTSRRSWFLPIAPSPDHPDANSKATRKRFPTLRIANGAALRCDSYVNIRNVYKIDWTLLKPYANANYPSTQLYCFERESLLRMLAKSKTLTKYDPGPQFQRVVELDAYESSSGVTQAVPIATGADQEEMGSLGRILSAPVLTDYEPELAAWTKSRPRSV